MTAGRTIPLASLVTSLLALACTPASPRADAPPTPRPAGLMTPRELQALPRAAADLRAAYGADSSQYGELRVPAGPGPHPVVVLVHGGCFKAAFANARDLAPMGDALKADGIASWTIEYRRLGEPAGGWPETYRDVGRAVDHLRALAGPHRLDLARVVVVGHSAGGHLAMWAAARRRVPTGSALHVADPLPVRGVVDLAGPLDMAADVAGYEAICRDPVITTLLGGTPSAVPERYAQTSPRALRPLGLPQVLVWGEHEDNVPQGQAESYVQAATEAGDSVRLVLVPAVGHFEIASPLATPWPAVRGAIRALLDGRLPPA
jgi:acetyl esterase/lipase